MSDRFPCSNCGELTHEADGHWVDRDRGLWYCTPCANEPSSAELARAERRFGA